MLLKKTDLWGISGDFFLLHSFFDIFQKSIRINDKKNLTSGGKKKTWSQKDAVFLFPPRSLKLAAPFSPDYSSIYL